MLCAYILSVIIIISLRKDCHNVEMNLATLTFGDIAGFRAVLFVSLRNICSHSYGKKVVYKHTIASGHQIDVNDASIMDKDENWFKRGVKEAKNPSLNCNGRTINTLSHSRNSSIDTLRSFYPFPKNSWSKESTGREREHLFSLQPQTCSKLVARSVYRQFFMFWLPRM